MNELVINFASPTPVYEQLKKIFKFSLARNTLVEGETLPSIRELATFLKINPNTVARAYRELQQEGLFGGRAGIGFWVSRKQSPEDDKLAILREEFQKFLEKAVSMGFSPEAIRSLLDEFLGRAHD